ncbi:MAG: HAD family hydrolase [Ignavibacteriaceae bacterium]|nr:HAD family hydrolase [Ignavibacteriaceae bacterium]
MKCEGVIFDLDGTLVNSLEDLADSMNKVLSEKGYPVHSYEPYKYFVGNGIRNLVVQALPESARTEEIISACYDIMIKYYGEYCLVKTRLYDGIAELIKTLKEKNIKLAVLSNKADELTKQIIGKLLNSSDFEIILGAKPGLLSKPDTTGALLISKHFGIPPENIFYLGDTKVDMITANKAGMFAVGVLWGFRTKEELLENGAKEIISHPSDLFKSMQ